MGTKPSTITAHRFTSSPATIIVVEGGRRRSVTGPTALNKRRSTGVADVRGSGGVKVGSGGANPAGDDGKGVRGESERVDTKRDGDGAIGVRTCETNVGACERRS